MSLHTNTLTHIQEVLFDVTDLLRGESYRSLGYRDRAEMLREFQWKLERIEKEFSELAGISTAE